ncbi:MAG: hypothetical protein JRN15_05445 [Nitrososphaerota archaeon]|nr:hypothetical protein [Nitrososphaerota archaeon]
MDGDCIDALAVGFGLERLYLFDQSGFVETTSKLYPIRHRDDMYSHLKVDGFSKYLSSLVKGIFDTSIRNAFFTKEMVQIVFKFSPYIAYGIYTGRKDN